ncbi:unnamed protein product, partial [Mesorhabditis spiculigera]
MSNMADAFRAQLLGQGHEPPTDAMQQMSVEDQGAQSGTMPNGGFCDVRGGFSSPSRGGAFQPPNLRGRGGSRGGFDRPSFGGGYGPQGNYNRGGPQQMQQGFQPRGGYQGNRGGYNAYPDQYGGPPRGGGDFGQRGSPRGRGGHFQPNRGRGGQFGNISQRFDTPVRPLGGHMSATEKAVSHETTPPENPMNVEEIALLNKFIKRTVRDMREGTIDIKNQQQDPTSPLHSLTDFRSLRLKKELIEALDMQHFLQPSKIQEFALPLLLMEPPTNMIAQSQSGTGKTAAFVLTMLSRVVVEDQFPQCICLAPTFELAEQTGKVVKSMAHFMTGCNVFYAVKGSEPATSLKEQIIIGTPGKLWDYISVQKAFDLSKIKCVVLDEADVMISQQGHKELSMKIYGAIEEANPTVQALLFSATYDEEVFEFAEKIIKNAVTVTLRKEEQTLPNIKQFYVECANREAKYEAIENLYSGLTIGTAIIFCHTISSAKWLAAKLVGRGQDVALLHGQLTVQERASAIHQFREGKYQVLITTNVCARGIDVSQVSIVINYDPPILYNDGTTDALPDYDTYLHRIGRTGRFGQSGIAINFVDSQESLRIIRKIEEHFGKSIIKLDPADIDQLEEIDRRDAE